MWKLIQVYIPVNWPMEWPRAAKHVPPLSSTWKFTVLYSQFKYPQNKWLNTGKGICCDRFWHGRASGGHWVMKTSLITDLTTYWIDNPMCQLKIKVSFWHLQAEGENTALNFTAPGWVTKTILHSKYAKSSRSPMKQVVRWTSMTQFMWVDEIRVF